MIDEQPVSFLSVLTMGTLSLGIVAFPELASLGASFSYLFTPAFALDGSSTLAGLFDSPIFNFPTLIKFLTLYLNVLQSSIE